MDEMRLVVNGKVVTLPDVDANYGKVRKLLDDFRAAAGEVKANRNWSNEGKRNHILKLANEVLPKIESYKSVVGEGRKSLTSLYRTLPGPASDAVAAIVDWEIRDTLRSLDPLDAQARLLEAVATGNERLVAAVVNAPMPVVPPNVAADAKKAWESKPLPGMEDKVEELESMTNRLEYLIGGSIESIRKEAGIADDLTQKGQ
jgi:hypothetical protein